MNDKLAAVCPIDLCILRGDAFGRTVHHHIDLSEERVERTGDGEASAPHRLGMFGRGRSRQSVAMSTTPASRMSFCAKTAVATRLPITP